MPNATRSSDQTSQHSTQTFIAGLVCGVVGCLLIQWLLFKSDAPTESQDSEPGTADRHKTEAPVLDFYESLKQMEVVVPEPVENTSQQKIYLLQAGSFQRAQDADSVRAQLILLNMPAEISKINNNGELWHRVIVGPFDNHSNMSKARTTLRENGIDSLLLTQQLEEPSSES